MGLQVIFAQVSPVVVGHVQPLESGIIVAVCPCLLQTTQKAPCPTESMQEVLHQFHLL